MGVEKDVDEPGRVELEAPVAGSDEQLAAAVRVESFADDSWQTNPPTGIDGRRQGTTSTRAAAGLENEPVTVGLCSQRGGVIPAQFGTQPGGFEASAAVEAPVGAGALR